MALVFFLRSKGERFENLHMKPNLVHLAVGSVFVAVIILVHVQLIRKLDLSALTAISFFNLLFLFLLFPLEGPLLRKVVLLIAGNQVGALWYIIQLSFEETFSFLNVDTFKIIILVAKPIIDFVWIVSIWSLSLSLLAPYKRKTERLEKI